MPPLAAVADVCVWFLVSHSGVISNLLPNEFSMHMPYLYKSTAFVRPNLYGLVAVHVRSGRTRKEKSTVTAVLKMAQSVEV